MKEFYYYLRDGQCRPVVTVCLLQANGDIFIKKDTKKPSIKLTGLARGISICSIQDNVNKEKGKVMARGRAIKALVRKESGAKIQRPEAADVLNETFSTMQFLGEGKYDFNPILSDLEKKLMTQEGDLK